MYRLCSSLILIAFVAGCQVVPTRDAAEVRRIIERHNSNLERWYAEGRIDLAATVFAEDTWQMPPNSPPIVGRQAFIDFWTQATSWGTWTFELELQELVVSGPIAVERGRYVLTFEPGADAPMPHTEDHGNYVVYWRLEPDGEWRIVWDAPVSDRPPAWAE